MLDRVKKIFETRLKKERLQFSANFANNNSKFTYYIYNSGLRLKKRIYVSDISQSEIVGLFNIVCFCC